MKILHVVHFPFSLSYGGGQIYIRNLISTLNASNVLDADVICLVSSLEHKTIETTCGKVNIFECFCSAQDKESILNNFLLTHRIDVIHAHGDYSIAIECGIKNKIPVVVTIHCGNIFCLSGTFLTPNRTICNHAVSDDCLRCSFAIFSRLRFVLNLFAKLPLQSRLKIGNFAKKHRVFSWFSSFLSRTEKIQENLRRIELLKKCAAIIAPNNALAKLLATNQIKENVYVVPHGICVAKNIEKPITEIKYPIKFVYAGRISPEKGVDIMLEAFKSIPRELYELHILGTGVKSYVAKMKKASSQLNVYWHGFLSHDEVQVKISNNDVMIHPAVWLEVFGLSIGEAMANYKPVIATKCGGSEMQIIDEYNGWLVERNDASALKRKILDLLNEPLKIKEASKHCKVRSLDEHLLDLIKIYSSVV